MTSQPFAIPITLLFIAAVPLLVGLIPRNRFYGIRTMKTLSDDRVWYPVNRLAALTVMIASGIYGLVAAVRPYDRLASDAFSRWGLHLVAFVAPLALGLSLSVWYSKRL